MENRAGSLIRRRNLDKKCGKSTQSTQSKLTYPSAATGYVSFSMKERGKYKNNKHL